MRIWLTKPFYESLPFLYLASGLALLLASLYLDYWYWPTICLLSGIVCLVFGLLILLRRRDGTGLLDGMWELPALDRRSELTTGRGDGKGGHLLRVDRLEPFATFRHTITYRQLHVRVMRATLVTEPRGKIYRWVTTDQARKLPTSSLVSKALQKLSPDDRG